MTKPLNILFAGTPAFGLPCLEALNANHNLIGVYTQPDRPAGRGRHVQASAIKEWALAHHLPVYQPLHFKDAQTVTEMKALAPDVVVVIAYGLILPQVILNLPAMGCINVHASLLPRWRGASPIQHALLHGDKESGITIMQMDIGMDTGAILNQEKCFIEPTDTAADLHDRLAQIAVSPLLKTLAALGEGQVHAQPQEDNMAVYAPKIHKEDAAINWKKSAVEIDQQIRAFNPWPIAYTSAGDTLLRIHQARVIASTSLEAPGTIISLDKKGMMVAAGEQSLLIERIQFPGAKAMTVAEWLNAQRSQLHVNLVLQ